MKKLTLSMIALALVVVLLLVAYGTMTTRVPTGYTAIITTFGKVEDYTLEAGFHFKSPFQNVVLMDNRIQKVSFTTQAFSSDIQQVDIAGSINFSIDHEGKVVSNAAKDGTITMTDDFKKKIPN